MTSTANLLTQTADRFNRHLEKAWANHPPPCQKKPGILPCDTGKPCPSELSKECCQHRKTIKEKLIN